MLFPTPLLLALRELSTLPYENLSKILAFAERGNVQVTGVQSLPGQRESILVLASEWVSEAQKTGVGGTCFSLTWWLKSKLQSVGYPSELLMGDKGNLKNIHCALKWDWQGKSYLLDPGFMIFDPLLLPSDGLTTSAWISPNQVLLEDKESWRMWSGPKSELKFRFDFRKKPVTESEFLSHWEASFDLPMMHYPIINRIQNGVQYYLQKRNLLIRTAEGSTLRKLEENTFETVLAETFRIPIALTRETLRVILKRNPDFFKR